MPVLELDEGRGVPGRDGVARGKAPLPVIRDPGTEQFSVPVRDDRRVGRTFEKVPRQAAQPACQKDQKNRDRDDPSPAHRVTAVVADSVFAATCGSYMAEQVTAGSV